MNFFKFSRLLIVVAQLVLAQLVCANAHEEPETDQQKTLYTFGYEIAKEWRSFGLSETEIEMLTLGIIDSSLQREPHVKLEDWVKKIRPLLSEKRRVANKAIIKTQTKASAALLAKEAKAPGAKTTASGLIMTSLKPGTGEAPKATSKVTVHYHGTLGDGTIFDSSVRRGKPATFPLKGVIKCWTEGLQLMKVGGKSRLVCPAELAYGDSGAGASIPPATALIFEVELLKVE